MSEFKGTRGPWFNRETAIYAHGNYIAEEMSIDEPMTVQIANAQLIAAAPELLEALEMLILFSKPTKTNAVALSNAYSVIAKALGETK